MANQTAGFGFRQAPTVGSTPATGGQAEYKIKSGLGVGIFQNNPVSHQHTAGDDGVSSRYYSGFYGRWNSWWSRLVNWNI